MSDGGPDPAAAPANPFAVPARAAETLHQAFEDLCLTPYQARVMVALLQTGSANCLDLARLAGIPRTSIYQILDELDAKGVACRLPGTGPAVWASVGRKDVLDRLVALEQERLSQLKVRSAQVKEMLDKLLPGGRMTSLPYVNVIHDPGRVRSCFQQQLSQTEVDLLSFNSAPYTRIRPLDPVLADAIRRIRTRAIFQAARSGDGDYDAWNSQMAAWEDAGAENRVVDDLPVNLAIFDRKSTLLSLDDPEPSHVGGRLTILVEHPGYTSVLVTAFENMWKSAVPYVSRELDSA